MNFKNDCLIKHKVINKVPTLFIYNKSKELKPIIFVFHKLLQNKESELSIGYKLAIENYFVVIFDLHGHGERNNSFEYLGKYDFNNLYKDIYNTAYDIEIILRYLQIEHLSALSFSNITCIGTSIGANVALVAGYLNNNIERIVSLIGSLDWDYSAQSNGFRIFKYFSFAREVMQYSKVKDDIIRYNPINNYKKINSLPKILFLNGLLDTVSPIDLVKQSYEKLKVIYENNNKGKLINLKTYEKAGHQVTYEMTNDLMKWLKGD